MMVTLLKRRQMAVTFLLLLARPTALLRRRRMGKKESRFDKKARKRGRRFVKGASTTAKKPIERSPCDNNLVVFAWRSTMSRGLVGAASRPCNLSLNKAEDSPSEKWVLYAQPLPLHSNSLLKAKILKADFREI